MKHAVFFRQPKKHVKFFHNFEKNYPKMVERAKHVKQLYEIKIQQDREEYMRPAEVYASTRTCCF